MRREERLLPLSVYAREATLGMIVIVVMSMAMVVVVIMVMRPLDLNHHVKKIAVGFSIRAVVTVPLLQIVGSYRTSVTVTVVIVIAMTLEEGRRVRAF